MHRCTTEKIKGPISRQTSLHREQKAKDLSKISLRCKASMTAPSLKKMNQEKMKERTRHENLSEENGKSSPSSITVNYLKGRENLEVKEKSKRGIQILKGRSKPKVPLGRESYEQCFSGTNFPPQYEEECPVNYSLKYSETEGQKSSSKNENSKRKYKEYTDYAETDLDQPTDFSLRYGEKISGDEDMKNLGFSYYDSEKQKEFGCCNGQAETPEETASDRGRESYPLEDQTPLMFSRSSSMNSLSSFDQITHSIPDERSSVVSDFSRMASGIISPSEIPDSPTQTAPPSPKRNKAPVVCFPARKGTEFPQKVSVFEDHVATYKQEDTPIKLSRATSLSSLNLDKTDESVFISKVNSPESSIIETDETKAKEEEEEEEEEEVEVEVEDEGHDNSLENKSPTNDLKEEIVPEKTELDKVKFELNSVTEVDERMLADCINIGIKANSEKSRQNQSQRSPVKTPNNYIPPPPPTTTRTTHQTHMQQQDTHPTRQTVRNGGISGSGSSSGGGGFAMKPNLRSKFPNETGKVYSTYEASDDAVRTYHTEGTPANISHAGSYSDLSTFGLSPAVHRSGVEGNSDDGSFCSGDSESLIPECVQPNINKQVKAHKDKTRMANVDNYMEMGINKRLNSNEGKGMTGNSNREPYLNNQSRFDYLRRKDHQITADETSTFATENSPCFFSIRSSLSDLTVNSADSPVCLNRPEGCGEAPSQIVSPLQSISQNSPNSISLIESEDRGIVKFFDFSLVLTPLEEALLEWCIRQGMPRKNYVKKLEVNNFKSLHPYDEPTKVITSISAHLSRLKLNPEKEKNDGYVKKREHFVCSCGRRHSGRRKK